MTWRDDLLPGSFRGIAFKFRNSSAEFGRRVVVHEYPLQDKPYAEDLGRKARKISLEAIIIGDDYHTRRDAMVAAVEQAGPGELVHPRFGSMTVTITSFRVRESTREGGLCTISLEVIESGELKFPTTRPDTQAGVEQKADATQGAAIDDFAKDFTVDKKPGWVAVEALSQLTDVVDNIRAINGSVNTALQPLSTAAEQFNQLGDQLATLILTPRALGTSIASSVNAVLGVGTDVKQAIAGYDSLGNFGTSAKPVSQATPSRQIQAKNQAATIHLVQRMGAINTARATSKMTFESYTDAVAVRAALVDKLDAIALTADYDLFNTVNALRAAVVTDINTRGADLPRVSYHTPLTTMPAVLLAYQLQGYVQDVRYTGVANAPTFGAGANTGNVNKVTELISRNKIGHPLFVPGGKKLEVLVR